MHEPERRHIAALDGLRGTAALIVVIHHSVMLLPSVYAVYLGQQSGWFARLFGRSPLHILWAGHEAVVMFFVLSGYVLSSEFWQGRSPSYPIFAGKRWLRLYPPYLVAMCFAACVVAIVPREFSPDYTPPIVNRSSATVDSSLLAQHLALYVVQTRCWVNPVIWSLVVEIQVSMVFPLLIRAMRLCGAWSAPIAVLTSCAIRLGLQPHLAGGILEPIGTSAIDVSYFVIGADLNRRSHLITQLARRTTVRAQWGVLAFAIVLITLGWTFPSLPRAATPAGWASGAALILIATRHFASVTRRFEVTWLVWVGTRSYSLYLLHFPIMIALVAAADGRVSPLVPSMLTLPLSLIAADCMYRFIESPTLTLGRTLFRTDAPSSRVTADPAPADF